MIRAAIGPWGSVRVEVKTSRGVHSVHTEVNGKKVSDIYNLEWNEACETADDLLEYHTNCLMEQHASSIVTS